MALSQDDTQWNKHFESLQLFKKKYGHCNVTMKYDDDSRMMMEEEFPLLACWVNHQRWAYKRLCHGESRDILSKEQVEKLESIGFCWKRQQQQQQYSPTKEDWQSESAKWEAHFQKLKSFKEERGHFNVPINYEKDPTLRSWMERQRLALYKTKRYYGGGTIDHNKTTSVVICKLTSERIAKLNSIGFEWTTCTQEQRSAESAAASEDVVANSEDDDKNGGGGNSKNGRWDSRFQQLLDFQRTHGHCHVPSRYPQYVALSRFVGEQRSDRQRGRLSQEQIDKLNSIGFVWNPCVSPATVTADAAPIVDPTNNATRTSSTDHQVVNNDPTNKTGNKSVVEATSTATATGREEQIRNKKVVASTSNPSVCGREEHGQDDDDDDDDDDEVTILFTRRPIVQGSHGITQSQQQQMIRPHNGAGRGNSTRPSANLENDFKRLRPPSSPIFDTMTAYHREQQRLRNLKLKYPAIETIRDWLCTDAAIGQGANPNEMQAYAMQFLREGLHSVEMIRSVCTAQDIEGFTWMKKFHKRLFIANWKTAGPPPSTVALGGYDPSESEGIVV